MSENTTKNTIKIEIQRDDNNNLVSKVENNIVDDKSMLVFYHVLQVILSDKKLIEDYTSAVLDFISEGKKLGKDND